MFPTNSKFSSSMLFFNVDLTLCDVATSYQPKNNVEPTLKCLLGVLLDRNFGFLCGCLVITARFIVQWLLLVTSRYLAVTGYYRSLLLVPILLLMNLQKLNFHTAVDPEKLLDLKTYLKSLSKLCLYPKHELPILSIAISLQVVRKNYTVFHLL